MVSSRAILRDFDVIETTKDVLSKSKMADIVLGSSFTLEIESIERFERLCPRSAVPSCQI